MEFIDSNFSFTRLVSNGIAWRTDGIYRKPHHFYKISFEWYSLDNS